MNQINPYAVRKSCRRDQQGLSLVELMVSITIGLILLAGVTTLIVKQSSTRTELEKASREIENGRYAIQLLRNDIEHAGLYGEYAPPNGTVFTIPDPCVADSTGWSTAPQVPVAIYGYAGGAADPTPSACLPNYKPNTDILVVRRTPTTPVTAANGVSTYIQVSRCSTSSVPFMIATTGFNLQKKDCTTAADLNQYLVNIYYVSSCDVCSGTAKDNIPTLKLVQNGAAPTPLVDGIEDVRFDYGIDSTAPVDGAPDNYTNTPAVADWQNVMAVRINLLARNTESTGGYKDTKTYSMGQAGTLGPFNDSYKRHVYSEVVRVINESGRREQ